VRAYSALGTGLAFLPFTLALGAMSLGITVRLVERFGSRRVLLAGLLCIAASLLLQSSVGPETSYFPRLFVTYALFGLGAGASLMPLTLVAMADVPATDAGLAAGITNVSMQVSAALGLAALGSVAASHTRSLLAAGAAGPAALTGGYQLAYTIAACLVGGALIVVLVALRPPQAAEAPELEQEAGLPPAA
jgi:MFS family permease